MQAEQCEHHQQDWKQSKGRCDNGEEDRDLCLSADWLHHSLPEGISHWDVDLGFTECFHSRLPPTHNESLKVQTLLRASNANREASSLRLCSHRSAALSKWQHQTSTATQAGQRSLGTGLGTSVLQFKIQVQCDKLARKARLCAHSLGSPE